MGIFLNLGCGETWSRAPKPWVNIDSRPEVEPDQVADLLDLPYDNDSVEGIYAGHVFEHIPLPLVFAALDEIKRVLIPGRDMLVVGPDVKKGAAMFASGFITWERLIANGTATSERTLHGVSTSINSDPGSHKWECSEDRMRSFLEVAGFIVHSVHLDSKEALLFPVFDRGSLDQLCLLSHKM